MQALSSMISLFVSSNDLLYVQSSHGHLEGSHRRPCHAQPTLLLHYSLLAIQLPEDWGLQAQRVVIHLNQ
jgi:hypothetical protein